MTSIMSSPAATTATRPLVSCAPSRQKVASRRSVPEHARQVLTDREFHPFRLDTTNQCLWRRKDNGDDERILLRPKSYAVLRYLVEHAGRLVTENELLETVWPDVYVQPQAVKSHLFDIRRVLGDSSKEPVFIETLPKRGYRFIAAVRDGALQGPVGGEPTPSILVGRQEPLSELRNCQQRALLGERQVVFISGEPGIGKTALVDEFQRQARLTGVAIARGQCIEGYGGKEAYYPMLEALRDLCRGPAAQLVIEALSVSAPTWLVQFPSLVRREDRDMLRREILGATRERMLREITDALESITAHIPLVLVFEDLHWGDDATVDLISACARARGPAKLMLLGTFRPTDIALSQHPLINLKRDLSVHKLCHEIELEPLSESDIAEYLTAQSPGATLPRGLAEVIYRHSEGNPLFMVAAIQHMTQRGLISMENRAWHLGVSVEEIDLSVPESLRHMIEAQIERLSVEEQRMLEVASVAGVTFSSVCVAAGTAQMDEIEVEDLCERLCRRHLILRAAGTQMFASGITSPRWEFVHALYRRVLYERLGSGRCARVHRRIGERLESLAAGQAEGQSSELAHHFEASADWSRAVRYLRMSAATAGQRFAHREAVATLGQALVLARNISGAESAISQAGVLEQLGGNCVVSFETVPRALQTYRALVALAAQHGLIDVEARALVGMAFALACSNARSAIEVIERALRLSAEQTDAVQSARTRARCLLRRIWVSGWSDHDAEDFHRALAEILGRGDSEAAAEDLLDCSQIQWLCGEYRESHRNVIESLRLLTNRMQQNPHLSVAYQRCKLMLPRSLLFMGEWGYALREVDAAIDFAERNAGYDRVHAFRVYGAWIHLHAMDFTGVLAIGEKALPWLKDPARSPWRRLCLALMASAEVALGEYERAFERQETVRQEMDRQPVMFDWYVCVLLDCCMTEVLLAKGDLDAAKEQAERLVAATSRTAERTWQALAWEASAGVALAEGEVERAGHCIERALARMEGFELPLADWRVDATAAGVYGRAGDIARAKQLRELSRTTIFKLADSLCADDKLQETFLSARPVRIVLEDGGYRDGSSLHPSRSQFVSCP